MNMGGNVFKDNRRMESKKEFYSVYGEQHKFLSSKNIHEFIELPRQIESKTSFGDMDLVVNIDKLNTYKSKLIDAGYPVSRNGIVLSYQTPEKYQIDLIGIDKCKLNYALRYFSFGDHGNILGRLVKFQFQLKHGFNGLSYEFITDSPNYRRLIELSYVYDDILDLLKLNKYKFIEGFETEEELFDWIYESPYMNTTIYSFDKLKTSDAKRDKKRKFYCRWLDYLKTKPKKEYVLPQEEKEYILDTEYPQLGIAIFIYENDYKNLVDYRNKFNRHIVKELLKIDNEEFGNFMRSFKATYSQSDINDLTADEVKELILNHNPN